MKNIIQKSLCIALCYYTVMLIGCVKDTCGTGVPPKKGKFQYHMIRNENLAYDFKSSTAFSTRVITADTIVKSQYGIRFLLDYKSAFVPKRNASMITSAYACSPVPDNFTTSDSIKTISVKTLFDLDGAHPAGSDVTDYFNAVYQFYSAGEPIRYETAFAYPSMFSDHYTSTGTMEYDIFFKRANIVDNRQVAFELVIEYVSGKSISAKTKPVYLK